jgi:hypothetical protein
MVTQQAPVLTLDDRIESVFELTPKELERYSRQIMLPNPHLSLWDIFTKAGHFSLRKIKVLTQVDRKGLILAKKHSANSSLQQF